MNWFLIFLIFLSICRFGDFSLSKLLIFLSMCRFCALLASKCWSFLSICRFWAFPYQNVCFFWEYAGLMTFHYQNFWFFWVFADFVHFWHQNVEFFWVYAGLVCLVKIMHFLLFMQVLERYKSQNLQRVCNFEVNKAQIKTGFRFWCSFYFILLKTSNHQNKTNRVCIKHRNLQCFLSMSFNVFNATLGSDTFPPSRGRPWGGGLPNIYIYINIDI